MYDQQIVLASKAIVLPLAVVLSMAALVLQAFVPVLAHSRDMTRPYSVQMHLHGHSNHNASDHPASIQWHTSFARQYETDVLWWSEHSGVYANEDTFVLTPAVGRFDSTSGNVEGIQDRWRTGNISIQRTASGDGSSGRMQDGYLLAGATSIKGSEWILCEYSPGAKNRKMRGMKFVRPLASEPVAEFELRIDRSGKQVEAFIIIVLSWHRYDTPVQYRLKYRFIESDAIPETSYTDRLLEREIPLPNGDHTVRINLLEDSRHLRDGDDATISGVRWGVRARDGACAILGIRTLRISSKSPAIEDMVEATENIYARYKETYGVTHHSGGEFSILNRHLNAFYPDSSQSWRVYEKPQEGYRSIEAWVEGVHQAGGLVSLNHPFGAVMRVPEGFDAEQRKYRVTGLLSGLRYVGAFGADILEVGYEHRGVDLRGHLDLWDHLTAAGIFLYGNGTTDSHGGEWCRSGRNVFQTWVWSMGDSPSELIEGMRQGRMFFGNGCEWSGEFDVTLGPYRAGDRIPFEPNTHELKILLDPLPESCAVYLIVGKLYGPWNDLEYPHRKTAMRDGDPFPITLSEPSFVRVEVFLMDSQGERPFLFSNPIVFFDPERASPAVDAHR